MHACMYIGNNKYIPKYIIFIRKYKKENMRFDPLACVGRDATFGLIIII